MPSPAWVESGAKEAQGLDFLGLRLSVQVIGNDLLDGVTTITPSVRYLSILCWAIHVYGKAKKADTWKDFRGFAARVEAIREGEPVNRNIWVRHDPERDRELCGLGPKTTNR